MHNFLSRNKFLGGAPRTGRKATRSTESSDIKDSRYSHIGGLVVRCYRQFRGAFLRRREAPPSFGSGSNNLLPAELLIIIFQHSLGYMDLLLRPAAERYGALMNLRLVCRQWDQVATSAYEFWTSYHFLESTSKIPAHTVQKWLERSAGASLDITLPGFMPFPAMTGSKVEYCAELVRVFRPYIARCKGLRMALIPDLLPSLQALHLSEAARLEMINLALTSGGPEDLNVVFKELGSVPNLRGLVWTTNHHYSIYSMLFINTTCQLSRLTQIWISCPMTTGEIVLLMAACITAVEITIDSGGSQRMSPTEPTHFITLSELRLLKISLVDASGLDAIHHFHLPNLRILNYNEKWSSMWSPSWTTKISHLLDWVDRSAQSLEVLCIGYRYGQFTHDQLCAFFSHPRVTRLAIVQIKLNSLSTSNWERIVRKPVEICEGVREQLILVGGAVGSCLIGWADEIVHERCLRDFPWTWMFNSVTIQSSLFSRYR